MEKRELHEAHSPILKPVPEESSALSSNTPSSPPPSEERKVSFNIGDSDDPDQKDCKESETGNGKSVVCDASHAMPIMTHTYCFCCRSIM